MKNWLEVEKRFRELEPKLIGLRLDMQSGSEGEFFRLATHRSAESNQVKSLSAIAGRLLARSLPENSPDLVERDPLTRWFKYLRAHSAGITRELPATVRDAANEPVGVIYMDRIEHYLAESANACLDLEALHPIRDDTPFLRRLYDDHGKEIINATVIVIVTVLIGAFFGRCSFTQPKETSSRIEAVDSGKATISPPPASPSRPAS